jgi:hypothetical protein
MKYKKFVSNQGWLSLDYPAEWTQTEEEEGTYLFMNNDNWKGSFRITPLKITGEDKADIDSRIQTYVNDEIKNNKDSKLIKFGQFKAAHYSVTKDQNENPLTILYWIFGLKQVLVIATFTIDTIRLTNQDVSHEINSCNKALETLKIDK